LTNELNQFKNQNKPVFADKETMKMIIGSYFDKKKESEGSTVNSQQSLNKINDKTQSKGISIGGGGLIKKPPARPTRASGEPEMPNLML
jgi:hypothetical protein